MKCDELQERWFEAYPVEGDQIIPTKVYSKKDADDAIAELKRENENLKDAFGGTTTAYKQVCDEYEQCDKELRATKRALWLARAELCHRLDVDKYLRKHRNSWYNENCLTWAEACVAMEVKMCKAESKCLAKAEEYK